MVGPGWDVGGMMARPDCLFALPAFGVIYPDPMLNTHISVDMHQRTCIL